MRPAPEQSGNTETPTSAVARPIIIAFLVTVAAVLLAGLPTAFPSQLSFLGPNSFEWAGGTTRLLMGIIGVTYLWRRGLFELTGFSGARNPAGLRRSKLLVVAAHLPLFGLFFTDWLPGVIGSWAFYIVGVALFESVLFRGVVFVYLASAWNDRDHGVRNAALVSALLFGLSHPNPVATLGAFVVAIAFTRLQLDTRSIYPAMVLHFIFDVASLFPLDANGQTLDSSRGALGSLFAVPALVAAGGFAVVALHRSRATIHELMMEQQNVTGPSARSPYLQTDSQ